MASTVYCIAQTVVTCGDISSPFTCGAMVAQRSRIFHGHNKHDGGLVSDMSRGVIPSHHLIAVLNSSFSK